MKTQFKKQLVGIVMLHALLLSGDVKAADCSGLKFDLVNKTNFSEEIKTISPAEFKSHILPLIRDVPSDMENVLVGCSQYERALGFASEFHANSQLYNLFIGMKQEVSSISLDVQPEKPCIPKMDIYLKEWVPFLAQQPDSSVTELYKRALAILDEVMRTDHILHDTLTLKKIMEEKRDEQRDCYARLETERIQTISQMVRNEYNKWEHVCISSGRRMLQYEWRKKDQ